jgi:hypothetical protein
MNKLIYLLFVSLFSLDWLSGKLGYLPRIVTWAPEVLSMIATVSVLMLMARGKYIALSMKYSIYLILYFTVIIGGIIVNDVDPGAIVAGLRVYLKYIPFFLLPMVYAFTDDQIIRQIKFLFFLSIMQTPVTLYQKLFKYTDTASGDVIGGTLGAHTSGVLTIYLSCVISILVAFYLKKRIDKTRFYILLLLLFIPMTINETKVTLVVLPLAIMAPMIFVEGWSQKIRKLIPGLAILIVIMGAFFAGYNHYNAGNKGSLQQWLTESEKVDKYLSKGDVDFQSGEYEVGRFDAIKLAIEYLTKESALLVGVGIGNATPSFSKKMTGEYYQKYGWTQPNKVYLSRILWEMGIVGVLIHAYLFIIIFGDTRKMAKHNDLMGTLAHGWISVVMIAVFSFIYFKSFETNIFAYLFWYFTGLIVADRYRKYYNNNNVAVYKAK